MLSFLSVSPSSPTCSSLDPSFPSPCRRESSDTHTSAFTLLTSLLPSISLYLLFYGFTPLSLSLSLSLARSLSLSHLFLGASGEHELWKDNRQVMGDVCGRVCVCVCVCVCVYVCVSVVWGRLCTSACVPYPQMTKATVRLRQRNPIGKYFHMSSWFCTDTEQTPTETTDT